MLPSLVEFLRIRFRKVTLPNERRDVACAITTVECQGRKRRDKELKGATDTETKSLVAILLGGQCTGALADVGKHDGRRDVSARADPR